MKNSNSARCEPQMIKYCKKIQTTIKLNFTMINLVFNVVVNVTRKWKENIVLHFLLLSFFSIYLGSLSCFYFCKRRFFITGNAPLILKTFKGTLIKI